MSQKYNRIIDNAEMEVSIEKSRYNDKFRYYSGFCADWGLSHSLRERAETFIP